MANIQQQVKEINKMTEFNCSTLSKTGRDVVELIGLICRHAELKRQGRKIPGLYKLGRARSLEKDIAERFERLDEKEKAVIMAFRELSTGTWNDWVTQHVRQYPSDKEALNMIYVHPGYANKPLIQSVQHLWQDAT
jgi:hypothetical protein